MKYKNRAKCSQCGRGFSAKTRTELLSKLRKHIWRNHADWMRRRIKAGKKKAAKSPKNPAWLRATLSGILPPVAMTEVATQYKAMSDRERAVAKALVTRLTGTLGGEASAIAAATLRALDWYASQ